MSVQLIVGLGIAGCVIAVCFFVIGVGWGFKMGLVRAALGEYKAVLTGTDTPHPYWEIRAKGEKRP